ncbi:MAG: transaldolase [Planctomycetota bacterium]|jgi:transaldolase
MPKTTIQELCETGQSIWLDNINRSMIESGTLKELINLGLRGMTSNPTIFDKAISTSTDYDAEILQLGNRDNTTFQIYDDLTIKDIQDAADTFLPTYEKSGGLDGYVSLEINPHLAFNTTETIEEGKRLYQKVNRPNVMFKVPATDEGFKAIEELISSEINVNVTLIFSLEQYIKTAQAYMSGIKRLLENNGNPRNVRSVASVFVSRIDTAVDTLLEEKESQEKEENRKNELNSLKGKAAVANSKLIYKKFQEISSSQEFKALCEKGANVQRVLWGSTSSKNPAYSDIKYVTELIGKNTVNTVPGVTLDAFLDHGEAKEILAADACDAQEIIESLIKFDIDINTVCAKLLTNGVISFQKSFDSLLNSIETKSKNLCPK